MPHQPNTTPLFMVREQPAKRTTTMETEVWIPAGHALITSLAWAIPAALLSVLLTLAASIPWYYIPLLPLIVIAILFPFRLNRYITEQRRLLWDREETEQRDINGDDHIGQPPPRTLTVEIVTRGNNGRLRQIMNLDFGIPQEQALTFIQGVLAGQPISEAQWCGNGRPFSKTSFIPFRTRLVTKGLIRWRNADAPAQGVELTPYGQEVFQEILAQAQHARAHAHAPTVDEMRAHLEQAG